MNCWYGGGGGDGGGEGGGKGDGGGGGGEIGGNGGEGGGGGGGLGGGVGGSGPGGPGGKGGGGGEGGHMNSGQYWAFPGPGIVTTVGVIAYRDEAHGSCSSKSRISLSVGLGPVGGVREAIKAAAQEV